MEELVSTEWLAGELGKLDLVVFDATKYLPNEARDGRKEFAQARIPGARYFDIDEVADPDSDLPHMVPTPARFAKLMEAMADKYSQNFPAHKPISGTPAAQSIDEVVLVSGTTGRLGAHLLAQLLEKQSVKKVYAINRPAKEDVRERQRNVFKSWELDESLLESDRAIFLEADFAKPFFGIGEELYNQVCFFPLSRHW